MFNLGMCIFQVTGTPVLPTQVPEGSIPLRPVDYETLALVVTSFRMLDAYLLSTNSLTHAPRAGLGTALSYKDFTGKSFPQQKFYKAELRGTNFTGADLTGANLYGAFAKDAIFKDANMRLSVLESVDFENAGQLGESTVHAACCPRSYGAPVYATYSSIIDIQHRP